MKVYVVYEDYGPWEGCSEPWAVFSTEEKAEAYAHTVLGDVIELTIDEKEEEV
jgi:glyoxylate utilization-related uncharacterized protein